MSEPAIKTQGLTKIFNKKLIAVNDLTLEIPPGVVYGLIGRNGAGKTTALRLMMGLLKGQSGTAHVLGHDLWFAPADVKERVTYVGQEPQLHPTMSVENFCGYLSQLYTRWDQTFAQQLTDRFELSPQQPIYAMSVGQRRKVAVLLALAARPDVVILDEPAAGLDPIARRQLIDEIINCIFDRPETTVLLSTHIISDLERLAEYVGIMDKGRLISSGRLDELQSSTRRVQIIFDGHAPPDGFKIPGAIRSRTEGPVVTAVARIKQESELDELRKQSGVRVQTFPLNLEELFIEMLGPEAQEEMTEVTP
jgi:ABC-2 type transport system ATP-binding protein